MAKTQIRYGDELSQRNSSCSQPAELLLYYSKQAFFLQQETCRTLLKIDPWHILIFPDRYKNQTHHSLCRPLEARPGHPSPIHPSQASSSQDRTAQSIYSKKKIEGPSLLLFPRKGRGRLGLVRYGTHPSTGPKRRRGWSFSPLKPLFLCPAHRWRSLKQSTGKIFVKTSDSGFPGEVGYVEVTKADTTGDRGTSDQKSENTIVELSGSKSNA